MKNHKPVAFTQEKWEEHLELRDFWQEKIKDHIDYVAGAGQIVNKYALAEEIAEAIQEAKDKQ